MNQIAYYDQLNTHFGKALQLMVENNDFGKELETLISMSSASVRQIQQIDPEFLPALADSDKMLYLKDLHKHLRNITEWVLKYEDSINFEVGHVGRCLELLCIMSQNTLRKIRAIEKG